MSEQNQDITHLRQRLARSNVIVDATHRFTSTLDSDEIQLALFEAVFQVVGAQQIALHLINEGGLESTVCYPMEGLRVETAVLPPKATAFRICEEVEQVIWHRDNDDQAVPPISVKAIEQFDSYLALPLKGADKVVGAIEAFNLPEPQNAAQQATLLVEIAGPAGLAIYNGMLYQEAQHEIAERKRVESEVRHHERMLAKRAAQLETVSRVSAYTSTILEPDKLLQEVVNLTKAQFELYHVHIYLVNEAGEQLDLVVGAGDVGRQMVAQGRTISLQQQQSLVAQVARSGQGLIENDVLNNPAFLPHPLLPDTRSEAAVPVILRGRIIGVLDVQSDRIDTFTEQDIQIQTMLATHIAAALENARSYEQAVTSLVETEALLDITKETSHVLELVSITDNVLDKVLTATHFDAGLITIVNPDTQKLEIKSHRLPEQFWNMLQENGLDGTLCDLVYRRQQSVVVVDMAADAPVDVTGLISLGYKSYQGVPLESQGEVLGTLCLFSRQPLTSEKANSVFLQAAGRQVGIAIRNVSLLDQAQTALSEAQQSRQLTQEYLDMQHVLHEINAELFRIDDLDELYRTAIELAHTRLGFERIGMYLLNESNDLLLGTYGVDVEGNICDEKGPEYAIDQKGTIDTFVLNRTRLVVDKDVDLWYEGEVVGRGWHIGAAMWTEDAPIGVIFADNLLTGQPLKPYQSELLFAYAGIVSNLIERNRFETIITKRAAEMEAVAEVGTAAATILDTNKLLQEVVDLTKTSFDLYHAHIYLLDKETEMLVLTSGAGTVGQQMVTEGRQIPLQQEQSLVARAARSRQGIIINDVQADPGFLPHPLLPDTQAEMAVPLIAGEQVLGVLDVQSDRLNYFTKEDISTFTTLAAQTAVALQNARLFAQSEERAEELAIINRIVTQMNTIQDVQASLQFLVEELGTATQASSAVVNLINTDGTAQEVVAAYLQEGMPDPVGTTIPIEGDLMMAQLLETRQTLVVNDVASTPYPPEIREVILQSGFRSLYIIPMFVGRDLIGSATISVLQGSEPLTSEQIRLAETLVFQATSVVQNIRLYAQTEQRETLLRTIIDSTPDWIFVKDRDHRYQMVNQGYADTFQIAPQDFIGKNDLDIGFPEDIVKGNPEKGIRGFWADDVEIMESGQMKVIDIEPAVVDGEQRYLHTIKAPLKDANGEVTAVIGFVHDITDRILIEETLRHSEAELSQALKIAKLAYWEYDVEKDLFTFNDQFFALFHTTAEEHGGYQLSSAYYAQHFVHPDDLPLVGAEIERGLNSTDRHYNRLLEHRILYADGGVGYISVNINLERDEQGNILRYYGANQDITERKQAEETLRRSEAELSEALKIAKLAYWEYDAEKDLFTFNDQFYSLFHTTAEQHGGYQLSSAYYAEYFVHPDDLSLVGAEIERALNSTDRYFSRSLEHRILYADGGVGYISVNINLERDEHGNILHWYGANQDITERKQAEEALAKRAVELETVAQVGTAASTILDTSQLLQQVVDLTKSRFGLYHTHIYLLNEAGNTLQLAAGAGEAGTKMVAQGWNIPLAREHSLVAQAARDRQGVIVNDVRETPGFMSNPLLPETHSELAVPLIVRDQVLGVLDVQSDQLNYFGEEDIHIQTTLAAQIAVALKNADQYAQTQEALTDVQQSQELLRSIIDATPDWIFVKDQEHRYRLANKGYADALHIIPEDFIGKDDLDLGFPEELVKGDPEKGIRGFWADDRLVMESGEMQVYPNDPATIDGEVHTFHTIKAPLRDADGQVWGVLAFARDITEREQAEEALRRSEAELSEALKIAKLAYWEYDVEKDLFTFNDQFFALFHTTAEEHGGYQLSSAYYAQHFVHPDDLPLVGTEIERALNSTDPHYNRLLEHRILYADGGTGYITVNINIDRDEQGNILRYYGANQDITERKLFEEAIQKERERVQVILESVNVPFAITKVSDGKVIYCNKELGDLVGVPHEELIGQGMPDFYANPSDREAYISQLREQGFVNSFDLHMKRADSQQYWALLSGRLIEFQGEPAIITFALDITERRKAQALIARRAAELETVANVSTVAATILEPEELLQQVVDLTKERFDLYHAHIYLLDEDMGQLTLSNGAGEVGRTMVAEGRQIALNQEKSLVARAARSREGVIINDVRTEPGFLPHPLLPETRAEMAVPLIAGEQVLGVLDVQAATVNQFSNEDISIFTTLAAQLAVALQVANQYQQIQDSEARARIILESVNVPLLISRVSDGKMLYANAELADVVRTPLDELLEKGTPNFYVDMADRQAVVGQIQKQGFVNNYELLLQRASGEKFWSLLSARLINFAGEVAIFTTLLDINERKEAETLLAKQASELADLTRRLTREGWQDYLNQTSLQNIGYIYDSSAVGQIRPVSTATNGITNLAEEGVDDLQSAKPLIQPITIRGEMIGQLAIMPEDDEDEVDSEIAEIIHSVIEQLGARIENLRLADQTQTALAQTEEQAQRLGLLNEMSAALNQTTSLNDVYQIAVDETAKIMTVDGTSLSLLNETKDYFEIMAASGEDAGLSVGVQVPIAETPMQQVIQKKRIVRREGEDVFAVSVYIPLVVGEDVIGTLNVGYKELQSLKASDENLLRQIATLISSNIESMRFLMNEQARAQREQMLRQITQRIRSSADVETIMRTAVQEIGRTLGRKTYIYLGDDREA